MIRQELVKLLHDAVRQLSVEEGKVGFGDIALERPENLEHGDYSTNAALVLASKTKKAPREVGELLLAFLEKHKPKTIERVEVAGAGFINFFLSKEALAEELELAVKEGEKYGTSKSSKGKKVMVEFTDPNPFKEFHVGHLYSNAVGECLSRLMEAQGAEVKRANYQGDVGMHVAKAVWGMERKLAEEATKLQELEKLSLPERVHFLGQVYAKGAAAFEQDKGAAEEIAELNKKIFEGATEAAELYEKGKAWSLEYFERIYERLGTRFEFSYFESEVGERGKKLVEEGLRKNIFQKSEGAVVFPGEEYGLHSRVFVNSQGLPTYEAKELGLAPRKYEDFPYDLSIIVTGKEVVDYFKVVLKALELLAPELRKKTVHISHGMVRLPSGKLSSRTGKVVAGEELLEEIKGRAREIMAQSEGGLSLQEKEDVAEMVAVGAVKYSLLRIALGKDIIFDTEKSLSLEGDSGPYLQYTAARCKSILRKANEQGISLAKPRDILGLAKEESALLRMLYRFPEVVEDAAENFAPHAVCGFLMETAQLFNSFYHAHPVLKAEREELRDFRLLLVAATANVLSNGLRLLGVKAPERM
ncbi:arginine--tRNA ligase [Patescibacteria group bacterium]|nr:arginine--tRNA ligase [Patescibacteria group bacterium]